MSTTQDDAFDPDFGNGDGGYDPDERYAPHYPDVAEQIHSLAVEVDTQLAPLWQTEYQYHVYAVNERKRLESGSKFASEELAAEYAAKCREARDAAAPLEQVYATHKWSRFFLVTNTNGHIHSHRECSTCQWDTQFAWLPELSGLTEAEAVEAYGEILCSVCFPSAPSEWTTGESKAKRASREEREAKKAARIAKKREKALFPYDLDKGIKVDLDTLKTIAAAKTWLTDAFGWAATYTGWEDGPLFHPSFPSDKINEVAESLAKRLGVTAEQVKADAAKRAAKRGW